MSAFLDTNVIIDILRRKPESLDWLSEQKEPLLITPMVWMEIVAGVRNKKELQPTLDVLNFFQLIYPETQDLDWAMHQQKRLRPIGMAIDIMDYIIASVCFRFATPMYTHNLKHFRPLLGDDFVVKPYNYI